MKFDLAVVGGGPVGSTLSRSVAKAGYKVVLFEEHKKIGEPVQCAGLVTRRALEMAGEGGYVIKKIEGARIFGPRKEEINVRGPRKEVFAIDRAVFDQHLSNLAVDAGVEIRTGQRVKTVAQNATGCRIDVGGAVVESCFVAGCDGPGSVVRRSLGLPPPKFMLSGVEVEGNLLWDDDHVILRCGSSVAPGFFAWAIPLGENRARIGLAVNPHVAGASSKEYLQRLLAKPDGLGLGDVSISRWMGGLIPLGFFKTAQEGRMLVAGDAACQVKATSGGGVVMGLKCAKHGADAFKIALEKDLKSLGGYDKAWLGDVGKELRRDWALHRYYSSMGDEKLSWAFNILGDERIVSRINGLGDIDYPSKLVLPLLKRRPSMLRIVPGLLAKYLMG
ncbi:MAG: NAD(P)/FAD-dependent oxidoreductase [Candidatus Thermoplasmatota archaeon]|nr:NAD(P)/FAD-dependent oxidoreductase [Candidatus Thermoplasmatota archaeon]